VSGYVDPARESFAAFRDAHGQASVEESRLIRMEPAGPGASFGETRD
jgi:hypothetical protein